MSNHIFYIRVYQSVIMYYKLLVIHNENDRIDDLLKPFEQPSWEETEKMTEEDWKNAENDNKDSIFTFKWIWDSCKLDRSPLLEAKGGSECYLGDKGYALSKKAQHGFCSSVKVKDIKPDSLEELVSDIVLVDGKWHETFLRFPTAKDRREGFYKEYLKGLDGNKILTNLSCHI